jgi:hypothetical protein
VATVELACRRALGHHFGRLVLVGSAALRVETPGSDVDVVCFTRNPGGREALGMNTDVLRRVYGSLQTLIHQYSHCQNQFSMELIEDARVPILRVLWITWLLWTCLWTCSVLWTMCDGSSASAQRHGPLQRCRQ